VCPSSDFSEGKPVPYTIWYGYVQGMDDEWDYFSQVEIERLTPFAWEIPKKKLPYSGRKKVRSQKLIQECSVEKYLISDTEFPNLVSIIILTVTYIYFFNEFPC